MTPFLFDKYSANEKAVYLGLLSAQLLDLAEPHHVLSHVIHIAGHPAVTKQQC